jgi:competence protein ComEC
MPAPSASRKWAEFWLTHPAVPLAVALALGIAAHDRFPLPPTAAVFSVIITAVIAAILICRPRSATIALMLTAFLAGVGLARRQHYWFATNDIAAFVDDDNRLIDLKLHLPEEPRLTTGSPADPHPSPPKQYVLADVVGVRTDAGWVDATGQLPVILTTPDPALAAGQTIRALGQIQRPQPAANPGEFDWAAFYRDDRILATLTVHRSGTVQILANPGPNPIEWTRGKCRHLLAAGFTDEHSVDHAVLAALLLGDKDPDAKDVRDNMQAVGLGYQLNVSGLHVGILAALVAGICWIARLRPGWRLIVVALFTICYAAVSTPTHSGIRSTLITVALAVAVMNRRAARRAQMIALVGGLMLALHPLDLFGSGFQLSFAVVIAIAIAMPRLRKWAEDRRDLLAPSTPASRWKKFATAVAWSFAYSMIAWVVTLPLLAMTIGQVSPWAPLIGLAMLPVSIAALIAAAVKVVATLLWPTTAPWWAAAAGLPVFVMRHAVTAAAHLPGSSITTATPSGGTVALYYALIAVPLIPWKARWRRSLWFGPAVAVALIVLPSPASTVAATPGPPALRITLISLGAGQCAVIETPSGHFDIVDAGSTTIPDVARRVIEPVLRGEGCRHIDDIFLSHGDFDHISAAGELAEIDTAGFVFISHHFRRNAEGNEPDQDLLRTLDRLPTTTREIATGESFDLGDGARIDVLWPGPTGDLNSNNAGLVLRLTYAGRSVLFPADIQDPAFDGLLQDPERLPSDVLVAPHHGSSESKTPAFLTAVHPRFIVASNAARLTQKQLRFNQMTGAIPLYRTSSSGAITVMITADGQITVSGFKH